MFELHVNPLHGEAFRFPLAKDIVIIGRSTGADLVLADGWLSRRHMEIRRDGDRYYLRDLDNRSGTYLNGIRITGTVQLRDGDVISAGDHQLRFVSEARGSIARSELEETRSPESARARGRHETGTVDSGIRDRDGRSRGALPALTLLSPGPVACLTLGGHLRDWFQRLRAAVGWQQPRPQQFVDCSVFGPPRMRPGSSILVQVFVTIDENPALLHRLARDFDSDAHPRGFRRLATSVNQGSKLHLVLRMPGLEVFPSEQCITWQGRVEALQFSVKADPTRSAGTAVGTLIIVQEDVPIGSISFKIEIVEVERENRSRETGEARRYEKVFISYASADRSAVQPRVQMLQLVGIRCYQDLLSLDPGDRWERKLYRYIDLCDGFFLFWSSAAKASEWVEKEWRYALDHRGDEIIVPVIIEGPPIPDPPAELSHLHFNDRMLFLLKPAS